MDLMTTPDDGMKEARERMHHLRNDARDELSRQLGYIDLDVRAAAAVPRTDYNVARIARVAIGMPCTVHDRISQLTVELRGIERPSFGRYLAHQYLPGVGAGTMPQLEPGEYAIVVEVYRIGDPALAADEETLRLMRDGVIARTEDPVLAAAKPDAAARQRMREVSKATVMREAYRRAHDTPDNPMAHFGLAPFAELAGEERERWLAMARAVLAGEV